MYTHIMVPIPVEIPYGYGIAATTGPQGCLIQTRGTYPEREKIKQAAAICGVSYGNFMRRVCNDAADYVIQQHKEGNRPATNQE